MINNNWIALVVTLLIAVLWLRFIEFLAHKSVIATNISRKLIHIGTGLIFILCWLLFADNPSARFFAAFVPFVITIQFIMVGTGIIKDQAAVDSMSRSGNRGEILRGPLYYGIVFVLVTILFWKDSPVGLISLILLCAGDGLAELVGMRFDSGRLPWSNRKTILGSLTMFVAGSLICALYLYIFTISGIFAQSFISYLPGILVLSFSGTIVESLTRSDLDNLTVPGIVIVLGQLVMVS